MRCLIMEKESGRNVQVNIIFPDIGEVIFEVITHVINTLRLNRIFYYYKQFF